MRETISIVIWGCNEFSARLVELLKDSNVSVVGFIDRLSDSMFCGQPVYKPHEFRKKEELSTLPIVIASPHVMQGGVPFIDFESIYQFKIKMQEIINEHHIENHLLHVSALIDFMPVQYPNKVIPFGLPGSGIVLFSHLCSAIIQKYSHYFHTKDKTSLFFERMCFEYTQLVHQIIPDVMHINDGFNFHMSAWKIGTSHARCPFKDDQIDVYSFSTRNHVIGPVYNYHYIPSKDYLEHLNKQKYKLFFNMRNPLDVILSCVNKSSGIDKETKKIDMKIFAYRSKWLVGQLNAWYPLSSCLDQFFYDDLIENPLFEIENLMEKLNILSSTKVAKEIWGQLAFKQLSTAPRDHFWSGGSNKWEHLFKEEHFSFLKAFGIEEVLEKYNYQSTLKKFKTYTENLSKDMWASCCSEQLIEEINKPLAAMYGKEYDDTYHFLSNIYGSSNCVSTGSLYVAGKNSGLIEKVKQLLDNKYVNKLVLAGAHPDYRIV